VEDALGVTVFHCRAFRLASPGSSAEVERSKRVPSGREVRDAVDDDQTAQLLKLVKAFIR
jgi:hypothetical protein